jgi:hypothetical protein
LVLSATNTAMPWQSAPELTDAVLQSSGCAPLDLDFPQRDAALLHARTR